MLKQLTPVDFDLDIDPQLLAVNMGPGKVFPGGPVCEYKGKRIPAFVTSSESGGISGVILVEVLKHLDKYGATERKFGDPPPCLLVDGHGSRLSIPFLRYINNLDSSGKKVPDANHSWNCYLGLPNATAYWQVGDSSQQNGRFKSYIRREKESIRKQQRKYREPIKIERFHVVPMVTSVWNDCFGDEDGNKKAILERGWNPLNRGCLVHPDIEKTKPTDYNTDSEEIIQHSSQEDIVAEDIEIVDNTQCCHRDLCGMKTPLQPSDPH